ncbi:transmembrane signal receptor [Lithospermum erythrorhizon]|uniref:Transmembrane signal receptor n=1 Tax=Lithospermum erythrorhizon TaxID=34254 RepID=A0AAV3NZ76_LITER
MHFEVAVNSKKWKNAMDMEINSIVKNNTWTLTILPQKNKKIRVKWIYKTKRDENGNVIKHRDGTRPPYNLNTKLVAKGYAHKQRIDFTEVYAPVARMYTVRMIISVVAQGSWKIYQLDVKSAFLHAELEEKVYTDQPKGY